MIPGLQFIAFRIRIGAHSWYLCTARFTKLKRYVLPSRLQSNPGHPSKIFLHIYILVQIDVHT